MKKGFYLLGLAAIVPVLAYAADSTKDFYQDILLTDEVIAEENVGIAKANASRLLDSKPKVMQIKNNKIISRPAKEKNKPAPKDEVKVDYGSAPFGLIWGNSIKEIKNLGVTLNKIGEKDYINNFTTGHLPKNINDFREVNLTFGIEDHLWRIIAYGKFIKDDASASEGLKIYYQYYKLLEKKYGHAQQFYTPNVVNVDKTITDAKGKPQTITEQQSSPIGGENFLSELQNGQATLYSTFENGTIGVALAINVDGDGQSYIVVDYKNLKILKEREQKTLDAL